MRALSRGPMEILSFNSLLAFWSPTQIATNILIFMNMVGALLLGLLVGYERAYHGHAAGMRTYGLVCMASAALTVITGYPEAWFGGHSLHESAPDPTRVVQGIVTGIGFLGAGVIVKEGFSIKGLTTAASIWAASVIGVTVGLGFYGCAILLTVLCTLSMVGVSIIEDRLPCRSRIAIAMQFKQDFRPCEDELCRIGRQLGFDIAKGSLSISHQDGRSEWRFLAVSRTKEHASSLAEIAHMMTPSEGVETFRLSHARQ
jgi:putative Mg2+ transporter-C (MgtC) family protein